MGKRCVLARVAAELLALLLVSVLWGCTNPLLKRATQGIEHVTKTNRLSQLFAEVKFLFLNVRVNLKMLSSTILSQFLSSFLIYLITAPDLVFLSQYLIPFLLNQCGSLVYYYTLSSTGEVHNNISTSCFIPIIFLSYSNNSYEIFTCYAT